MIEALKGERHFLNQIGQRLSVHHLALPAGDAVRGGISAAMGDISRAVEALNASIEELERRNIPHDANGFPDVTMTDPRKREG